MISVTAAMRMRFGHSILARRLLGGASWSLSGSIASSGIALLTMIFVARVLGKETYGQLVIVQSTLGMVGVLAGTGIGATATRYVSELRSRDEERLARILALSERTVLIFGAIAAVVLMLTAELLSSKIFNSPELNLPLAIASITVFFSAVDGYQKSVLIGLEAMKTLAIGVIVGAVASVPILLGLASAYGLKGAAGAMAVNAMIQAITSRILMVRQLHKKSIARRARGCCKEWRVLRDYALPALISSLLVSPVFWANHAMLSNLPNGYAELAILGVAMQWFNTILFLPNVAGRVVVPILTERLAAGEVGHAAKLIKVAIIANLAVAIPVATAIAFASSWIMTAYGPQFHEGWRTLALIAFVAVLVIGAAPVGQMLAASDRMWIGAAMNFGWAAICLGSSTLLVRYGSLGIVLSLAIAYSIHSIWTGIYVYRHITKLTEKLSKRSIL